jgi:pyruvate formate lyase activating enzyme
MEPLEISRREFLSRCSKGLGCLALMPWSLAATIAHSGEKEKVLGEWGFVGSIRSPFFSSMKDDDVQCMLCPRGCIIAPGERGYCKVRENRNGALYSLVYGNPCAVHIDPIEKKPFFHVLPGSKSFSLATTGCNLDCKFCQNWEISQEVPEKTYNFHLPPGTVAEVAGRYGCTSIAATYVEPTIFFEYMYDIAVEARRQRILTVYHSNGYINREPLLTLCRYLDAACIDLKGFTEAYYEEMTAGELMPVLQTLKLLRRERVHLELVNLIVPTKNDDSTVIRQMCQWIKNELGSDVPLHFSRFYPMYKLRNLPPTPVHTLEKAREIAQSVGLEYVYIGNVPGHEGEHTYCPHCHKVLIARRGYFVLHNHLQNGKCGFCGKDIPGIWSRTA